MTASTPKPKGAKMSDDTKLAEPTVVQLTRMEGTINLIKYQNDDMVKRVGHLELTTTKIQAEVQKLQLEAVARDATAIALAKGLKEAEEQRKDKSEQNWTPVQRFLAIITVLVLIGGFWLAVHR